DPLLVVRARADVVLLVGNPEQDHSADTRAHEPLDLAQEVLHRVAAERGQTVGRPRLRSYEQRHDEPLELDLRLAHQSAERGRATKTTHSGHRELAHGLKLYVHPSLRRTGLPYLDVRGITQSVDDLLHRGHFTLLVLAALANEPAHGYALIER